MKSIKTLLLLSLLLSVITTYGQTFTKSSIKFGAGAGVHMGRNAMGFGLTYSAGYQREIWRDRLSINANFCIGHYNSKLVIDARDMYFNSLHLEGLVFFDVLKVKSFSIVLGNGLFLNNASGLTSGGFDPGDNIYVRPRYMSDFNGGMYFGFGFRINPESKRIAVNILPFNFYLGFELMEIHPEVEIDIKI